VQSMAQGRGQGVLVMQITVRPSLPLPDAVLPG
jgi:hypothetical protein